MVTGWLGWLAVLADDWLIGWLDWLACRRLTAPDMSLTRNIGAHFAFSGAENAKFCVFRPGKRKEKASSNCEEKAVG